MFQGARLEAKLIMRCGSALKSRVRGVLALLAALAVAFAPAAHGQAYRGTINGTVRDSSGAVIVGASVAVVNADTHFTTPATTNSSGLYTVPFLTPGTYSVRVTAAGFSPAEKTQVVLQADDTKQVDLALTAGAENQQVTVTADQQLLQTQNGNIETVLTANELHNAPLIASNPYMMASRVAGVYSNGVQNTESSQWIPVGGGVSGMAFEGLANSNLATMNGIIITPPEGGPGGYTGYVPPIIGVQELNVQTSTYDAEIGRTMGGVLNTVLKTGTEKLHGELSFQYGDTIFNSNTSNRTALGQPRNPIIWSQPSFVVTGPVTIPKLYKGDHKTYFMVSYEHIQYTLASNNNFTGNVPTVKEQNGDFSELCAAAANGCSLTAKDHTGIIYDPTTTIPDLGAGTATAAAWCSPNCTKGQRESFIQEYNEPNSSICGGDVNCIPASRLNATGVNLLKFLPQPNAASPAGKPGTGNYQPLTGLSSPSWMWMATFSIDHEFNDRNKVTVAYLPYVWNAANANQGFPYVNGISGGPGYPKTFRKQFGGLIDYTSTLSPSMVLDVRSGGFYHPFEIPRPGDNIDLTKLGFTGKTLTFPHPNFPAVQLSGPFAPYTSLNSGASIYDYSSIFDNTAIITKSFRRHNTKFGAMYTLYRTDPQNPTPAFASNTNRLGEQQPFIFDSAFTNSGPGSLIASQGGDGVAALLLGYPSAGTAFIPPAFAYEWKYWAGFVQDDWRVTSKLVLNLGLRWDYMSPITERHNRMEMGFDFQSVNPMNQGTACSAAVCSPPTAGVPQGYHGGLMFVDSSHRGYTNSEFLDRWQPRIGFAYHMYPDTVVRGGFGIFLPASYPSVYNTGFSASTALNASTNGNATPSTCTPAQGGDAYGFCNISNPYPNGYNQPLTSAPGLSAGVGGAVNFAGPTWLPPKDYIYTLDVEQQLPFQSMIDIAYHGNHVVGLGVGKDWNALPNCYYFGGNCPNAGNYSAVYGTTVANPMAGYLPTTSPLNSAKIPQRQLYLPYPEFMTISQGVTALSNSNKRLGWVWMNALYVTVTKRQSHGLEFRVAGTWLHQTQANSLLNPGDDVTHPYKMDNSMPNLYLVGSAVWDLPKLHVNPALGYVVNGWKWSHSLNWQAGTTVSVPANAFSTGVSPVVAHRTLDHWFNGCYIPVVQQVDSTHSSPVYGAPTNCKDGEQPAWIQQPLMTLNQLGSGQPMHGVRLQEVPYYDMALMKSMPIHEGIAFALRVDAHNVLNIPLLGPGANNTLGSTLGSNPASVDPVSGKTIYTQYNDPRILRLEARLTF